MKKPLHILYLARWYPHKYDNMYGLFIKKHAEAAAIKHQITVFYVHACDQLDTKKKIEIKKGFINEYYFYYRKTKTGIHFLDSFFNNWKFVMGTFSLRMKISKPDLIHVHVLTRLGVLAYFFNKWSNIPYIITEHWSRYQNENKGYSGFLRKFLTRIVTSNASALTTVSMNLKDAMEKHDIRNKHHYIIYNVVDTKVFFPENKVHKKEDIKKLIHVSCFDDESKNISGLIQCMKELCDERSDVTIELIGIGKDRDKLIDQAKEHGLFDTRIFFTGRLEGRELADHIRSADILMLFSNYENMPVVINEAFCCGIPIISTDVGGIREIVDRSNGKLVPKGNKTEFVDQLNYMFDHLEKYDPKEISKKAIEQFNAVAISEKLDEIYIKHSYS